MSWSDDIPLACRVDMEINRYRRVIDELRTTIATLTADLAAERAEVERLRAAGDALVAALETGEWARDVMPAVAAWEEAGRER